MNRKPGLLLTGALLALLAACNQGATETPASTVVALDSVATVNLPDSVKSGFCEVSAIAQAFASGTGALAVSQAGTVSRLLSDDTVGDRHQRFILTLSNGQTLLVAHNIDIAARVPGVALGKTVAFKGVYEWNAQGGTVHWTHVDPSGSHAPGWLWMDGQTWR